MVRRNRARASSLFLMELIIAILFFSVASAVCVQFFVKSHLLSNDSNALNHAVNECTGVAEILRTADSIEEGINMLKTLYPGGSYPDIKETDTDGDAVNETGIQEADAVIYYNEAFEACTRQDAAYTLSLHMETQGQMLYAGMQAAAAGKEEKNIYELSVQHHIARRPGYEKR